MIWLGHPHNLRVGAKLLQRLPCCFSQGATACGVCELGLDCVLGFKSCFAYAPHLGSHLDETRRGPLDLPSHTVHFPLHSVKAAGESPPPYVQAKAKAAKCCGLASADG